MSINFGLDFYPVSCRYHKPYPPSPPPPPTLPLLSMHAYTCTCRDRPGVCAPHAEAHLPQAGAAADAGQERAAHRVTAGAEAARARHQLPLTTVPAHPW